MPDKIYFVPSLLYLKLINVSSVITQEDTFINSTSIQ